MSAAMLNPQGETESLPVHVAVCQSRYEAIDRRLRVMEKLMYGVIAVMLANGAGVTPMLGALLGVK